MKSKLIFYFLLIVNLNCLVFAQDENYKTSPNEQRQKFAKAALEVSKDLDHLLNRWTFINNTDNFVTDLFIFEGDEIRIKAKGRITVGKLFGSTGPNGFYGNTGSIFRIVRDLPYGALICKIGKNGKYRLIGDGVEFTAETSGRLKFIVNDNIIDDNRGSFNGEISLSSPYSKDDRMVLRANEEVTYTENQKKELIRVIEQREEIDKKYIAIKQAKLINKENEKNEKKKSEYNEAIRKLEEAKKKIREAKKTKS